MSTATSRPDKNLYSVSRNILQFYAGTNNANTMGPLGPNATVIDLVLDNTAESWDTYVKVCDETTGVDFVNFRARQGGENVLDNNNRAHHCSFQGQFGETGQVGDQLITVKGGCHDMVYAGTLVSLGRNADIVIGNWSDQNHDQSYNLDFTGLKRTDGRPITVIMARCYNVKLPPGAKVLFWSSVGLSCYWWLKRAYVAILKALGKA